MSHSLIVMKVLMSHVLKLFRGWPILFRMGHQHPLDRFFSWWFGALFEARQMPSFGRMYSYLWITFCNDASLVVPFVWWESSFGRSLSLRFRLTVSKIGMGWDGSRKKWMDARPHRPLPQICGDSKGNLDIK